MLPCPESPIMKSSLFLIIIAAIFSWPSAAISYCQFLFTENIIPLQIVLKKGVSKPFVEKAVIEIFEYHFGDSTIHVDTKGKVIPKPGKKWIVVSGESRALPLDLTADHQLLKKPHIKAPFNDLEHTGGKTFEEKKPDEAGAALFNAFLQLNILDHLSDNKDTLHEFLLQHLQFADIRRLNVKPGHRIPRKPDDVKNLVLIMLRAQKPGAMYDEFREELKKLDKEIILLDLITDSSGHPQRLDIQDAHHRLIAFLEAGYTLQEVFHWQKKIVFLVNGIDVTNRYKDEMEELKGERLEPLLHPPVAATPLSLIASVVEYYKTKKAPTFQVPNFSNADLGYLMSLERSSLLIDTRENPENQIGVYFFDHSLATEELRKIERYAQNHNYEEIILVPATPTSAKVINELAPLVFPVERLNLYMGDIKLEFNWDSQHGPDVQIANYRNIMIYRMVQIFGLGTISEVVNKSIDPE